MYKIVSDEVFPFIKNLYADVDWDYANQIVINLVCDFFSKNQNDLFYTWGMCKFSTSRLIAFRIYHRSLFKEYKNRSSSILYGSLD